MKKTDEAKIEKVVLNLGGEKVSLTPEQAQKLRTLLNDLFGQQIVTVPYPVTVPVYPYQPVPYWQWSYSGTSYGDATFSVNSSYLEIKI